MSKKLTFVIGDVHGMYNTLIALLKKIPSDSNIIFVGDLIDRGKYSAQVVDLVRQRGYKCVLGNHENTFINFFDDYFMQIPIDVLIEKWGMWIFLNGGKETLQSYKIWDNKEPSAKILEHIKSDYEWMKSLPIYQEINAKHKSDLRVVVSHSNITKVWHLRSLPDSFETLKDIATRTRDLDYEPKSNIVNIFGHTPITEYDSSSNCINLDTGCYYYKEGLGRLTAYCIEDDRFVVQEKVSKD